MTNRDAKTILRELADKAANRYLYDTILTSRGRELSPEQNAKLVGKLIENLPEEDRKILSKLSSRDIAEMMTVSFKHPRPEKPITRRRGPVSLKK